MVSRKRILAVVLSATLVLGGAVSASAAVTSPTDGAIDGAVATDTNKNHNDNTVIADILSDGSVVVRKVTGDSNSKAATNVKLSTAQTPDGKKAITEIAANAFNSKDGQKVTTVNVAPQKKIVVKAKAFNKSKVSKVKLTAGSKAKVQVNKNAFKGTKKKNATIIVNAKKASQLTFKKGAFKGLNGKAVIKVKGMKKAEFKKLQKKAKKAGFKGTIKKVS